MKFCVILTIWCWQISIMCYQNIRFFDSSNSLFSKPLKTVLVDKDAITSMNRSIANEWGEDLGKETMGEKRIMKNLPFELVQIGSASIGLITYLSSYGSKTIASDKRLTSTPIFTPSLGLLGGLICRNLLENALSSFHCKPTVIVIRTVFRIVLW